MGGNLVLRVISPLLFYIWKAWTRGKAVFTFEQITRWQIAKWTMTSLRDVVGPYLFIVSHIA